MGAAGLTERAMAAVSGRREFLGAPLDPVSMEEAVTLVASAVRDCGSLQHGSLNAATVARLHRDPELRRALWGFDLVTADGQGVVWCARLFGLAVRERVTGIDLMESLLELASARRLRVFLLGAREPVVRAAAAAIGARYPGVVVAGARHGYFAAEEEERVVREIADAGPDLLFVGMPTPAKELILARNREQLGVPFAMGVGGSLDVLAGVRRRAPRWMQGAGLEWLARLVQEPVRLAPALVVGNGTFVWLVGRELVRSLARRVLRGRR